MILFYFQYNPECLNSVPVTEVLLKNLQTLKIVEIFAKISSQWSCAQIWKTIKNTRTCMWCMARPDVHEYCA